MEDEQLFIFSIEFTALVGHDDKYLKPSFWSWNNSQRDKFAHLSELNLTWSGDTSNHFRHSTNEQLRHLDISSNNNLQSVPFELTG